MNDARPLIGSAVEEWPPFELAQERQGTRFVLTIAGELDMATAPALRERLTAAIDAGATSIVVDLRDVAFMDSIGLATVLHARSRLGAEGRLAIVLAHDTYPQLVLETAGLPRTLALFESREAAIADAGV